MMMRILVVDLVIYVILPCNTLYLVACIPTQQSQVDHILSFLLCTTCYSKILIIWKPPNVLKKPNLHYQYGTRYRDNNDRSLIYLYPCIFKGTSGDHYKKTKE